MITSQSRQTTHTAMIDAPAKTVYSLIEDVTAWPLYFEPNVHVEYLERGEAAERIQVWAIANGEPRTWISRRLLEPESQRIHFRQEVTSAPVAAMSGEWVIEALADRQTRLTLHHDFSAVDDEPASLDWIEKATERNSVTELAALKSLAERHEQLDEHKFSLEDSVSFAGSPAAAYEFLYQAEEWPWRLPHVSRLDMREEAPGIQVMEMQTRAPNGTAHTTKSVRVCFPARRIVYKQTVKPALMRAHAGEWVIEKDAAGKVTVIARHQVIINAEAVDRVLGAKATVQHAKDYVRSALSANSGTTLQCAMTFAEGSDG